MKIKVGNYILKSDKLNFWIEEGYVKEKGKHKGETDIRNVTGYCYTFEKCLKTFRERKIGESDATNMLKLLEVLQSLFEDIDAIDKAKFEEDKFRLEEMSKWR